MRLAMIGAAFVIPIVAVVLALTLRGPSSTPPLQVHAQNGSYAATVGVPLSVTAFRITNSEQIHRHDQAGARRAGRCPA